MDYPEFRKYQLIEDKTTLANAYQDKNGNLFYVEPGFYFNMQGFKDKRPEAYDRILAAIDEVIQKEKRVVFTGNFETPFVEKEGFIYREIEDITDPLGIFFEDKSRGSDYGD